MQPPLLYTHTGVCSYIQSACLSFSPQQPRCLSFSLSLIFLYLSLYGTQWLPFILLFSPEPKTKGAPTAPSAHTASSLLSAFAHTGACFDWPLSRELHSLEPMEAAAILYRAKKKKKRLQMK
jgi:hypothetical protein